MAGEFILNDRYKILEEIGRGGMGVVYRAEDTLLERPVAIKTVFDSSLGTEGRARLLQEARAAARLNHPNIVAVYDVGQTKLPDQDELSSYIVMEFVEGHTLREYQPSSLRETVDITKVICGALDFAHQEGVIHRDLKPENISVTITDTIKLMDFGLARVAGNSRLTGKGTLMGTLSYLAPEIILGQEASTKSDLYALGVILYEMSAGRPPFEGADLTAVISQHIYAPVVPPSAYNDQISPTLDELIVSLLNKRPEDRPESAALVQKKLMAFSQEDSPIPISVPVSELDRLVRGRMIGREAEFAEAVQLWQQSYSGNGQLLLISGEPGIGKTRLVRELSAYAEIAGGNAVVGLCYAQERTPYGPIAQMVQSSMVNGNQLELPEDVLVDLVNLAPELQLHFTNLPTKAELNPEDQQQRLFHSVVTWLSALNQKKRLLLVIEDAHWVDSGSLAIIRHLVRRLKQWGVLLVATYREVELDEGLPFQDLLNELNRERLASRIKLSRLNKDQTREVLTTLFAEEITPEFLDGIFLETEGNPFFIQELCKALVDSGDIFFSDGRWQRPAIEELAIPQSIRLTIQTRLSKLNNEEQTTLRLAALLGREFEYEMLLAIAGQDEDGLIDVLEKADQAQLIEEIFRPTAGASTKFSFTHALIHTTLLSTLSTLRRQRLQRQVAMSLEQAFPERHDELASLLGRYFAEADDGEKAVYYLLRAGDAARRIYAYDEAIQAYEQALLFLREQSDHQRAARTFMKLGLAYHNTYSHQKSRRAYEEGLREWRKSTDTQKDHSFPPAPHPLRAVAQEGPSGLDVSIVYDNWSHFFIHQLFSGLFEFTDDDQLVPDIAQSWDVLEKDKRYVFHLRKNATWSDGEPVTARDFEFSWKRSLQPGRVQGMAYLLYDIKGAQAYHQGTESDPDSVGVRAEDDYTLRIDLERSSSYFLQILAHAIAFPIPRHMVERLGPSWTEPKHIVTNGPFKIGEWSPKKKFILEKDLNYRGYFKGNVSQLEVQIQPPETWLELYMENAIDYMFPYLTSAHDPNRSILSNHEDYISLPSSHTGYLGFDVSRPPFDDIRVRQAVIMAIDRQTVIYNRARGLFLPANGGLVAPGIPGHVPDIALPYDPELAAEKLAAAGYPDGKTFPNVEIMMPLNMEFGGIFNRFAEQWKANLGLDVTYRAYEFNELLERHASDNPKVWIGGWSADYPDPDSYLRVLLRNSSTGWFHQGYEKLIYDAREITDVDQRMAMYQQAERILTQEAVLVPLSHGRLHLMVKPWISSLPFSMFIGIIPKEVVIEPHE